MAGFLLMASLGDRLRLLPGLGAAALIGALWLCLGQPAGAAPPPAADADAALIQSCLNDAAMKGRDMRECGDRVVQACLAEPGSSGGAPAAALACEKRRRDAWILLSRQAYRQVESKLPADADKRLLRTSQVQFELALRDLCTATRTLTGSDPELTAVSCASELVAARALALARIAAGRDATAR